jgi:hypothetical protein
MATYNPIDGDLNQSLDSDEFADINTQELRMLHAPQGADVTGEQSVPRQLENSVFLDIDTRHLQGFGPIAPVDYNQMLVDVLAGVDDFEIPAISSDVASDDVLNHAGAPPTSRSYNRIEIIQHCATVDRWRQYYTKVTTKARFKDTTTTVHVGEAIEELVDYVKLSK